MKKNAAIALISFAILKWHECLSVQLPFESLVQILVQLLLELEVNLLDQNVNKLQFELSKIDETTQSRRELEIADICKWSQLGIAVFSSPTAAFSTTQWFNSSWEKKYFFQCLANSLKMTNFQTLETFTFSNSTLGGFICTSPSWLSVTSSSSQCCWIRITSQMIECYQFRCHFAEPKKR